ncbi:MAG: peptidoglycan DD-metalloendopeptidase family protein [Clostridia bacterium]|nr:peptidoglycan DD-metalloendopeptidase family protein [Clostridia bacterium]
MDQQTTKQWLETAYKVCFVVGVRSIRCLKALVRFTRLLWVPIAYTLHRALDWLLVRHFRSLRDECHRIFRDYHTAKSHVSETALADHGRAVRQLLAMPILAVRRHRGVVRVLGNVVLPVSATVVLVFTLQYWTGASFALALEYQGTPIGYIADEGVYAGAATIVRGTVINADDSFTVEQAPDMRIEVLKDASVLGEQEVSDRILQAVGGELTQAAGLYVDSVFRGALPTRDILQELMGSVLSAHKTDKVDGVDFFSRTEIVEGLYPSSSLTTAEQMVTYLHSLTVKTMRNIQYTETIPYKTVYQETTMLPLGYESVQQKGKNGKQRVYAQEILVNGVKKYETVLSTEVIQAAVDRVVLIGAQKYSDSTQLGDGKATGTFIWPLPYTKQISSYFANRWGSMHGAIDIANGSTNGKPIIASDGGTVMEAEYHSSWGNYVLIDHGNGFKTRYAHCSKLEVKVGDKVAQGQYIAKVGNTGYSTGPHLHFEVIKNGVLVDPLKYVQR